MASVIDPGLLRPRGAVRLVSPAGSAKLAAMADALSVADGGFTVDPVTGHDITSGYAVSVHPECERILIDTVAPDDLHAYLTDVADTASLPGRVLGGWRDPVSGAAYLDVSIVVDTLTAALQLARRHGQCAVFDFAALASVPVAIASVGVISREASHHDQHSTVRRRHERHPGLPVRPVRVRPRDVLRRPCAHGEPDSGHRGHVLLGAVRRARQGPHRVRVSHRRVARRTQHLERHRPRGREVHRPRVRP